MINLTKILSFTKFLGIVIVELFIDWNLTFIVIVSWLVITDFINGMKS